MAADLQIHVLENATVEDLAAFFANSCGSKFFNPNFGPRDEAARDRIARTPNVWIGEVSWLKAALFNDAATFVPATVQQISDLIGEALPVIDQALIDKISAAFKSDNTTNYGLVDVSEVQAFLEIHKGKQAFTISW